MENGRKLVIFPGDQFYAIVGTIRMPDVEGGPYGMTLADLCNDKSGATHGAREHLHRPGRIYLTDAEFYALRDNTQKVCATLNAVHLALKDIRGIIDYHPGRFEGNARKRREQQERTLKMGSLRFLLHDHVLSGEAEEADIYRLSEKFLGLSRLQVEEFPEMANLSLPGFLEMVGCRQPDYMAVNLARVYHS